MDGTTCDALRALGGSGAIKAVYQKIQETLKIPDSFLAEKMPGSEQTRFYNEVAWARQYLFWEGLVESPERGIWALTPKAQGVVLDELDAQKIAEKWAERHKKEPNQKPDNESAVSANESNNENSSLQETPPKNPTRQYWTFSPGEGAEHWEELYQKGITISTPQERNTSMSVR